MPGFKEYGVDFWVDLRYFLIYSLSTCLVGACMSYLISLILPLWSFNSMWVRICGYGYVLRFASVYVLRWQIRGKREKTMYESLVDYICGLAVVTFHLPVSGAQVFSIHTGWCCFSWVTALSFMPYESGTIIVCFPRLWFPYAAIVGPLTNTNFLVLGNRCLYLLLVMWKYGLWTLLDIDASVWGTIADDRGAKKGWIPKGKIHSLLMWQKSVYFFMPLHVGDMTSTCRDSYSNTLHILTIQLHVWSGWTLKVGRSGFARGISAKRSWTAAFGGSIST